jgi:D-sedoheptulose 7-phosphate isomerase
MGREQLALASLHRQVEEGQAVREDFFRRQSESVVKVSQMMGETINAGGKLIICGNGGSAADSLHFSGEMIGRMLRERRPLPAISLAGEVSALTAIGNDYGYDMVFARGVEAFGKKGDLLFAISTSGKSANVLKAVESARRIGMNVVALTGNSGGPLGREADYHLNVGLGKNSPRIQEVHIQVIHLLVDLMDEFFLREAPRPGEI